MECTPYGRGCTPSPRLAVIQLGLPAGGRRCEGVHLVVTPPLYCWGMDSSALLVGLTDRQREAVTTDGAPVVIIAGAGSGKTRVLTRRIAYRVATGDADPRHVLALTFTRKAAGELRSRLASLGVRDQVAAGTFHAIAFAQLRQYWADNNKAAPTLLERKVGLLARLSGVSMGRGASSSSGPQPIDLAAEIEWAKARCITPETYESEVGKIGRRPPLASGAMASLYERYELEKRRRGLVDFDDLLMACVTALETDSAFAARQRWQFRHLFVDEVQDLNPAQARLLAGWRGNHDDLCVVGDPNQAIYSWNGADPSYLRHFAQREAGATVIVLSDNFRSSPQVLGVADAVLASGPGAKQASLQPNRPDGPIPSVRAFASDRDEARGIARSVRDAHQPGHPWSNIAVLTRTNAQLVVLEEAFRAADIPYRVRGGGAFLDRPEVQTALGELQSGSGSLEAGLSDLAALAREDEVESSVAAPGPVQERRAALVELVRLGHEYRSLDATGTSAGFLTWLTTTLQRNDGTGGRSDVVELSTFHAAKGLEWEVVFLAGLEQGLVPIGHAKRDEDIDEERRLLYVAITRAEKKLHCSWTAERTFGSRAVPRKPSPWLAEIDAARAALADGNRPGPDWRGHLAEQRSRLHAANAVSSPSRSKGSSGRASGQGAGQAGLNADPDILAALKQWRSTAAKAAGVPAYVIFHDTTLAIVAETRPQDRKQLLALPGLGPVKAERYGDTLLQLVAEHVA